MGDKSPKAKARAKKQDDAAKAQKKTKAALKDGPQDSNDTTAKTK